MKKNSMKFLGLLVLVAAIVMLKACSSTKHDIVALSLSAMTAGSSDLNGANAPTGVDPTASIVATFTTNIDATTATAANITVTRDFDKANIPVTITVATNKVTIKPNANLNGGALFVVSVSAGLKSTDALAIVAFTRSFTTSGSFTPDGQISYWNFDGDAKDALSVHNGNATGITYVTGRNTAANMAASFDGTTSIIEVPNGDQMINPEFSIAFWMDLDSSAIKADGTERGHFVMGMGAFNGIQFEVEDHERWVKWAQEYKRTYIKTNSVTDTSGTDFFYNGSGILHGTSRDTSIVVNKTQTAAQIQAMIGHQWNHVVYTFSASTKLSSLYWNGVLIFQEDYNFFQHVSDANMAPFYGITGMALKNPGVAPGAADYWDNTWAFGFWESKASTFPSWNADFAYPSVNANHFQGQLDDVHLYHRALSSTEVTLMYNSEK